MDRDKDKTVNYNNDENKVRGNWTHKMDFLLSSIGYAVGLGNIWRFPYRAYQNGGASFLIPYTMTVILAGLPMVFMEMALGQFSSLGALSVWKTIVPFLKGLGWAMVLINFMCCIYYNMVIAYGLYYLFSSFTSTLPWQNCRPEWTVYGCHDRSSSSSFTSNQTSNDTISWCQKQHLIMLGLNNDNNSDYNELERNRILDSNFTCSIIPQTPSEIYWRHVVLDISDGIDIGTSDMKWDLVLCLLLAWIIVFCCIIKGIKSSGKVVYFTAIFPYVVLTILLIWNVQLEGAWLGIKFYLIPDWNKLSNAKVWYSAGTQIFYSLGIGFGSIGTMASYNRFHNNVYRDAIVVVVINCATSLFAGFVIFSVVGFMATRTNLPVDSVVASGPGLAFIAYPEGLAMMPVAPLWSCLFFLMIFTLGIDSQFAGVEAIKTAITDEYTTFRKGRRHVLLVFFLCLAMFLIGLPQCSRAGIYIMTFFDWYSVGLNVICIALIEVLAIAWIYGVGRFCEDIEMMIGHKPNYYWTICWMALSPLMMLFIFIFTIMDNVPASYSTYIFPDWVNGIGWILVVVPVLLVPIFAIHAIGLHQNGCTLKTARQLLKPVTSKWGPSLEEFRTGRYQKIRVENQEEFDMTTTVVANSNPSTVITPSLNCANRANGHREKTKL